MQTNHTLINFRHLFMAFHNFLLFHDQNTSYNSIQTNKQLARRIGKYAILNSVSGVHECIQISNKISIILLSPSLEIVIISSFSVVHINTSAICFLFENKWKHLVTFEYVWFWYSIQNAYYILIIFQHCSVLRKLIRTA